MATKKKDRTKIIAGLSGKSKRKVRKHLSADSLIAMTRKEFQQIPDHRADNSQIALDDILMSAFAIFSLKDPSLLAFDKRRQEEPENLHTIFGITDIPCDSQMRTALDPMDPARLRSAFQAGFRQLQRGKAFEKMAFLDDHYLLSGDGTGFYSSEKVGSEYCLKKQSRSGKLSHYLQMYAGAFVHPDHKEVIPLYPEMITNKDGATKNDCERNASRRFFEGFRLDHPHLKVILVEDGLSSNAPHIHELQRLDLRFILGAKPGDHAFLFDLVSQAVEEKRAVEFSCTVPGKPEKTGHFCYVNDLPINQSNQDVRVNFLQYKEENRDGKIMTFSWVTDLPISAENVVDIMRAGRARWKIENETFNTLKNQGYNLGHNYGLGEKNLSAVFTTLMMLAFLIDQIQQMSCWLFQEAWKKAESKRYLWESVRAFFRNYRVDSMETIYRAIAYGFERHDLKDTGQT